MSLLDLFIEAGNLKRLPRTGWLLAGGVPNPESVAEHGYRVALITLFLADELGGENGIDVDVGRAVKIALLHDLAEARITDVPLTAQRYLNKAEAERKAAMELFAGGTSKPGGEYFQLWREYEDGLSREGKLVRFADKLEMLVQALEYEKAGFRNLDDFWGGTLEELRESEFYGYFRDLVEELAALRGGRR